MRRILSWAALIAILAFVVLLENTIYNGVVHQSKTLWDSLDLLGTVAVPVVIAVAGYLYTQSEAQRTQAITDERSQDTALQNYLDRMGTLLIDKDLLGERDGHERRTTARAFTLTVLEGLSPNRKRSVVRFLYEAGLIYQSSLVVSLRNADLRKANLTGLSFSARRIPGSNLTGEDSIFERAKKKGVYPADLAEPVAAATFSKVDFRGANLRDCNLTGVDLAFTDLRNACLTGADLKDAFLLEAKVTNEQLRSCKSLEGATMPNDEMHD